MSSSSLLGYVPRKCPRLLPRHHSLSMKLPLPISALVSCKADTSSTALLVCIPVALVLICISIVALISLSVYVVLVLVDIATVDAPPLHRTASHELSSDVRQSVTKKKFKTLINHVPDLDKYHIDLLVTLNHITDCCKFRDSHTKPNECSFRIGLMKTQKAFPHHNIVKAQGTKEASDSHNGYTLINYYIRNKTIAVQPRMKMFTIAPPHTTTIPMQ